MPPVITLGAVAYDAKVVPIWDGFQAWLATRGLAFDYILYTSYERQVAAHLRGDLDVAWNSPLAWLQAVRLGAKRGVPVSTIAMRDTDRDLTSVVLVMASGPRALGDLRRVGVGAADSPQATLIPLQTMRGAGLVAARDFTARRFDVQGGKHGDHVGGERDAAAALVRGDVDAAWMIDGNFQAFAADGTLPAGATRIVATTVPFDHCNFTTSPQAPAERIDRFVALLRSMSWEDAAVRTLLELEGLRAWLPGRTSGYASLTNAVDAERFYDEAGRIVAEGYRY